jgi:cytochrome d ubiquinol oxidase subunit II
LFSFIIQAVSYEYRSKPNNFLGRKTFEIFLFLNGLIGTLTLGVAVATFFTGSGFHITDFKSVRWDSSLRGLEALGNFWNISLGLAIFFLARTLGLLYFLNNINDENIIRRSKKQLWINAIPFVIFFLTFLIRTLFADGFALDPATKTVYMEKYKYLNNFIEMPLVAIIFVIGVLMTLWGVIRTLACKTKPEKGIWWSGIGVILVVVMLLLNAGYNNTSFYPSNSDLQSSLTIYNSSSSKYTLTVMSYVSLLVPFVFAYIWFAWKTINKKKIDSDELTGTDEHVY